MIDFHCHLDLYEDPENVAQQTAQRQGFVLAVTTTPLAWDGNCARFKANDHVEIAVGLHPELVAARRNEADLLCKLVKTTRFVGEIGLDGTPNHRPSLTIQQEILARVLKACELVGGRIMSLHSRGAVSELLHLLAANPRAGVPVLHWFSGSPQELERSASLGCWFSVGPSMLGTKKGESLVREMPRKRVITETDGPLARNATGPLFPWDVRDAEVALASIWGCSHEAACETVSHNLRRLLESCG
jgi:TatD DNase family protein